MPAFRPSEFLSGLPWIEIRRLYEVEGVSVNELKRRYNIASRNTIDLKIKKEGWRSPNAKPAPPPPVTLQYDPATGRADAPDERVPPPDIEMIPAAAMIRDRGLRDAATQLRGDAAADRQAQQQDETASAILGMHDLAALHTERIKEQIVIGQEVTNVGRRVLDTILTLINADASDPAGVQAQQAALRVLIGVSPDKDTLAGLLKAAAQVVSQGISIERRALGMDVRPRSSADPIPTLTNPARPGGRLIQRLDIDTAMRLREAALNMVQERRAADIRAQEEAA